MARPRPLCYAPRPTCSGLPSRRIPARVAWPPCHPSLSIGRKHPLPLAWLGQRPTSRIFSPGHPPGTGNEPSPSAATVRAWAWCRTAAMLGIGLQDYGSREERSHGLQSLSKGATRGHRGDAVHYCAFPLFCLFRKPTRESNPYPWAIPLPERVFGTPCNKPA